MMAIARWRAWDNRPDASGAVSAMCEVQDVPTSCNLGAQDVGEEFELCQQSSALKVLEWPDVSSGLQIK